MEWGTSGRKWREVESGTARAVRDVAGLDNYGTGGERGGHEKWGGA